MGLVWSKASRESWERAAEGLQKMQRKDGGWSQLAAMPSDAFATGMALYALYEGGVSTVHPAYRKGLNYLLDTQTGDTWVMHRMQRKGRFIGVWVPNYKVNTFDEEERIVNSSTNRQDILPLPPGVL